MGGVGAGRFYTAALHARRVGGARAEEEEAEGSGAAYLSFWIAMMVIGESPDVRV